MTAQTLPAPKGATPAFAIAATLGLLLTWTYLTTFGVMANRWAEDPRYSHGYLVPLFAGYLLWLRRDRLREEALQPHWLGLLLLIGAAALRLYGAASYRLYFDQISLLPALGGMALLAGGRTALHWAWPAITFLAFMVPLPFFVEMSLSGPMQTFATLVSTFVLQTLGRPALAEGNVILLNDIELNIVEACSGLRMLVVFFALSTAVAMLMKKPLWERLFIALSAAPIALIANVLRISITGLCYDTFGNHYGGQFFHDAAGWLMMPLGLAMLGVELWILGTLLIDCPSDEPIAEGNAQPPALNPLALYGEASGTKRAKLEKTVVEEAPIEEPAAV
jgi:exosortase